MFVAGSTECFAEMPLLDVFDKLGELEFTSIEIAIHESGMHLKPSEVAADMDRAISICRDSHRLDLNAYSVEAAPGENYFEHFEACCRLAKATKVSIITVPSAELGTPFNEEVERLRKLVDIANVESVLVCLRTQQGCLSEDPDTVQVLSNNVKGLAVTLDPSHFMSGANVKRGYDPLIPLTANVYLRDSSPDRLQVRVGQGEIDYGKLVNQLSREKYERALTVHMHELPDIDHESEMRKIRLLLESWL